MGAITVLTCDRCGYVLATAASAQAARAQVAREQADARLNLPGGRDLCAECARRSAPRPRPGTPARD